DRLNHVIREEQLTPDDQTSGGGGGVNCAGAGGGGEKKGKKEQAYDFGKSAFVATIWGERNRTANTAADVGDSSSVAEIEHILEDVLDEVFPELREQIEREIKRSNNDGRAALSLSYRQIKDEAYAFRVGVDGKEFHATLVQLPTNVEIHKTTDQVKLTTIGRVTGLLI